MVSRTCFGEVGVCTMFCQCQLQQIKLEKSWVFITAWILCRHKFLLEAENHTLGCCFFLLCFRLLDLNNVSCQSKIQKTNNEILLLQLEIQTSQATEQDHERLNKCIISDGKSSFYVKNKSLHWSTIT